MSDMSDEVAKALATLGKLETTISGLIQSAHSVVEEDDTRLHQVILVLRAALVQEVYGLEFMVEVTDGWCDLMSKSPRLTKDDKDSAHQIVGLVARRTAITANLFGALYELEEKEDNDG